jgi:hypothetical protein
MPGVPWQEVWERFDPRGPPRPAWYAPRDPAWSPTGRIARDLARPFGERSFLILGSLGSGKSTELSRVGPAVGGEHLVLQLDLWAHFEGTLGDPRAMQDLLPWEVVQVVALGVLRLLDDVGGPAGGQTAALARDLGTAIRTLAAGSSGDPGPEIDALAIARLVGLMVVGVAGRVADPSGWTHIAAKAALPHWPVKLGRRRDPGMAYADQAAPVRALLDVAQRLTDAARQVFGRPIILVVDGLDRVQDDESIAGLFEQSTAIWQLGAPTVLTAPAALRNQVSRIRGAKVVPLDNAPVFDRTAPLVPAGWGVAFLRDVFARRTADLAPGCAAPEAIDRLAWASAGRPREFVRLVRLAVERAYDADLPQVDLAVTEEAVTEARKALEFDWDVPARRLLESVMAHPTELPGEERTDSALLADLIARNLLLPYPGTGDDEPWWYPNTLLLLRKLRPATG